MLYCFKNSNRSAFTELQIFHDCCRLEASTAFCLSCLQQTLAYNRFHSHSGISNGAYRLSYQHTRSRSTAQIERLCNLLVVGGPNNRSSSYTPASAEKAVPALHSRSHNDNAISKLRLCCAYQLVQHIQACQIADRSDLVARV